jgi:homoserine trans-succinylase
MPRGYFDSGTESALTDLREKAIAYESEKLLTSVTAALKRAKIENTWHSTASHIYKNWLNYICERKNASQSDGYEHATCSVSR